MEPIPQNVITELQRIQADLEKAPEALYQAEVKLAEAENAYDTAEAKALLNAEAGTVTDRQAIAKLESAKAKLDRDLARAEVNRVKTKIRTLESASMATAVIAKQVELMWKAS
jgi:hypothetical protein